MVGPVSNMVPYVGPLRPDAGLKEQEARRIENEQSKQVSRPAASGDKPEQSDEILTAENAISKLAQGVAGLTGQLSIDEDSESGDFVYRIVDPHSGETLNQWPREELLKHARIAREQYEGLVVDEEA